MPTVIEGGREGREPVLQKPPMSTSSDSYSINTSDGYYFINISDYDVVGSPSQIASNVYTPQFAYEPAMASIRGSSGSWTPQDDQTLMAARAQGMNWAPIQQAYFPSKTPNACRKRHERLMERRSADDWDGLKLETLAKNYMGMRREIWSGLAARAGENWNLVEQKCMSSGLKNLQTRARSYARRERMLEPYIDWDAETEYGSVGTPADANLLDRESPSPPQMWEQTLPSMDAAGKATVDSRWSARSPWCAAINTCDSSEPEKGKDIDGYITCLPLLQPQSRPKDPIERHGECSTESVTSPHTPVFLFQGLESDNSNTLMPVDIITKPEWNLQAVLREVDNDRQGGTRKDHPMEGFEIPAFAPWPLEDSTAKTSSTNDSFTDDVCGDNSESESEPDPCELSLEAKQYFFPMAVTVLFKRRFMNYLARNLASRFIGSQGASHTECPNSSEGTSSSNPQPPITSTTSNITGAKSQEMAIPNKKRAVDGDDGDENHDDDEDRKRARRGPPSPSITRENRVRFPCPYHKLDSQTFGPKTTAYSFCGGTWPDISKLKEHLYRAHHIEFQCQRCKLPLNSIKKLNVHVEENNACLPRARHPMDGFSSEVWRILHSKRKAYPGQTEEDKWLKIYQLLFPQTQSILSPYKFNLSL